MPSCQTLSMRKSNACLASCVNRESSKNAYYRWHGTSHEGYSLKDFPCLKQKIDDKTKGNSAWISAMTLLIKSSVL